ncbi:MAG: hypothetical protein WC455_10550 [Dehalococcoidia bacterium]
MVHATVIRNGTELETMILSRANKVDDVDEFVRKVNDNEITDGTHVVSKEKIKKSKKFFLGSNPDFTVFVVRGRECTVIELKDGDTFDTKKAGGERTTLEQAAHAISQALPFSVRIAISSFNASTRDEIVKGMKGKFSEEEVLTGREFCELIGVNYDEIITEREKYSPANKQFFKEQFLELIQ